MTVSSAAHGTRRALAGLGIVAASILVLAPVAGAERAGGPDRDPSAHSSAEASAQHAEASEVGVAGQESPGTPGRHEQTICHRTGSAADPYVRITVAYRTVDGEVVSSDGGHESHDGPVFDPATAGEGDRWGDIIPPFTTADGASYDGRNWPAGQAIFENGCEPADPQPASAPAGPTVAEDDVSPDEQVETPERGRDERGEPDGRTDRRELGPREDGEDGQLDEAAAAGRSSSGPRATTTDAVADVVDVVDERVLSAGGATGDIAAVLGDMVIRDAQGEVVPTSGPDSAIPASLARTDSDLLVLLMLGLAVLIGGYVAVDTIRDRVRRTD